MSGGDICDRCGDWRPCDCDRQLQEELDEMFDGDGPEEEKE
jgi:hypothetical protein